MKKKTIKLSNKENRKIEIAQFAIKCFLKKGVNATSIREIAKTLNISIGTLYYYFESKEQIVDLVCDIGISSIEDFTRFYNNLDHTSSIDDLYECIKYLIHHGYENQDRILFFNREVQNISTEKLESLREMTKGHIRILEQLLYRGIEKGELKVDNPSLLAFNIWSLQQEWVLHRWALRNKLTVDEYINQQVKSILGPISTKNLTEVIAQQF
jgi:AcrR family transcriptional regulator